MRINSKNIWASGTQLHFQLDLIYGPNSVGPTPFCWWDRDPLQPAREEPVFYNGRTN